MLLQNFIRTVLTERSRYEKETGRTVSDDIRSKLMSLASETHPTPYAFTMTSVERVGVNPKTDYDTPAGVYFYPLTKDYCQKLFDDKLPFASDRKFVGLVKLRGIDTPGKWLKLIRSGKDYVTNEMLDVIKNQYPDLARVAESKGKHWHFNNDAKIFDIGYFLSKNKRRGTIEWNAFLRKLGFVGIYDAGNGIIHPSEKTQLVCLSPAAYQVVDIFETDVIRKKRDKDVTFDEWFAKQSIFKKLGAAQDTKTSKKMLFHLSKSPNTAIRLHVAQNTSTPPEVLWDIAKDENEHAKCNLFQNPQLPIEIARFLTHDKSEKVKRCARNYLLENLPQDDEDDD